MKKKIISKEEMQARIKAWIERVQNNLGCDALFRFEDCKCDGCEGAGFKFSYDSGLYEVIEYYNSDGMYKELGSAFMSIADETGWWFDFECAGVAHFLLED